MGDCASVVIPTCNKKERLALVLDSFRHQTVECSRYEVIVIDDGSDDGTEAVVADFVGAFELRYIKQVRKGRSSARNRGIQAADCAIIIFCDDDTIASPDFLAAHLGMHSGERPCGVHGKIYNLPFLKFFRDPVGGTLYSSVGHARQQPAGLQGLLLHRDYASNHLVIERQKKVTSFEKIVSSTFDLNRKELQWLCCTGGNFSASASLLRRAGMFDENFGLLWGGEDIELGYRLSRIGIEFHYSEEAVNYHVDHYRQYFDDELMRSWKYFYQKHPDKIISALPKLLLGDITGIDDYLGRVNGSCDCHEH